VELLLFFGGRRTELGMLIPRSILIYLPTRPSSGQHTHAHTHTHRTLRDTLFNFLSTFLGIDASRLTVELTPPGSSTNPRFAVETTIVAAEAPTVVSAYEAATKFLVLWAAPYSAQAEGLDASVLELDGAVPATMRYADEAPPAPTPAPAAPVVEAQEQKPEGETQGLDQSEAPEIGPPASKGARQGEGNKPRAATAAAAAEEEKSTASFSSTLQRAAKGIPRATLLGVGAAAVLVAALALMGVYALRRHGSARTRTGSVLRVQSTGQGP